jgi:uncharacterized lipoprotein YddW (UPF0748 family)
VELCRTPLIGLAAGMLFLCGCQATPRVRQPVRAIWVTRSDYRSPEDVMRIMADCQAAGFNTVLFQVRGNGTAFYKSDLEPWADELGGSDPGWDPLALACEEAHARDMELHAWVNVMPAWRGTRPPTNPDQLYNRRPEWFWYDQHGQRQPLTTFYVSVNPCLPEVRAYLVDVFREIVTRYDVDGLHLDYIRFPNEPPATPPGSDIDYPRDARTLELYAAETGLSPDDDKARWNQWRCDQVTELVRQIRDMVHSVRPDLALTAAVGTRRESSLAHFRDDRRWAREKLVDAVIPMNYVDDPAEFEQRLDDWLAERPPVPVIPGLWFGRHRGKTPEEAAQRVRQQIEIARAKTGNFCVFSYAALFDRAAPDTGPQPDTQPSLRQVRRAVVVPYIQKLAASARR